MSTSKATKRDGVTGRERRGPFVCGLLSLLTKRLLLPVGGLGTSPWQTLLVYLRVER